MTLSKNANETGERVKVAATLVTYQNPEEQVATAVKSFLGVSSSKRMIIVDNASPDGLADRLESRYADDSRVTVVRNPENSGFGAGHNFGYDHAGLSDYLLVLNPDVDFEPEELERMIAFLDENPQVGLVGPKVKLPDGNLQRTCRRNPTFFDLFARRFLPGFVKRLAAVQRRMELYEMKDFSYDEIIDPIPFLCACFLLIRSELYGRLGGFDEKFFMYYEDADLTRRVNEVATTVYFPAASITHHWARGAHRNWRLSKIAIQSGLYYFKKWGWKWI